MFGALGSKVRWLSWLRRICFVQPVYPDVLVLIGYLTAIWVGIQAFEGMVCRMTAWSDLFYYVCTLARYKGIFVVLYEPYWLNTSPPRQFGRKIADDTFNCISFNEDVWISIEISLKFVPNGPIDDKSALVQVMAWRRTGDKPLPKPMLTQFTDAYMRH